MVNIFMSLKCQAALVYQEMRGAVISRLRQMPRRVLINE